MLAAFVGIVLWAACAALILGDNRADARRAERHGAALRP
jgi:hypothetical protein